jgi:hypothetical protein
MIDFLAVQGAMTMAYPTEDRKGTYIAIVWVIFNLGGVIGGLASLAINFNNTKCAHLTTVETRCISREPVFNVTAENRC